MKKNALFVVLSVLFCFCGCKNQNEIKFDSEGLVNLYEAGEDSVYLNCETQLWHESDECICIVYGYGYNDEQFVSSMNQQIFNKYGNFVDGGKIFSLVFPDDFKRGSKYFISGLYDYISDKTVKGIVILGAPEGTSYAIARLQDKSDGKLQYPVFSLFSQDEILGMEYSADFVLDKSQQAEINGIIQNEENQDFVREVPDILVNSIECMENSDGPFEKNARLIEIVKKIANGLKVSRYYDPETNLPSINHFVLE